MREDDAKKIEKAQRDLAIAYEAVLGRDGARDSFQERVYEDFARMGFEALPPTVNSKDSQGALDPLKVASNCGKQEFFMHVRAMIRLAEQSQQPQ